MRPDLLSDPGRRWAGTLRAALLAYVPLLVAAGATALAAALAGQSFHDVVLLPPDPAGPTRFALALVTLAAGWIGVYVAPGLLLMRALGLRLPNAPANALAAFVLSLFGVSLAWIVAQAATEGIAGRSCLYLTIAVLDAAALVAAVALAPGAPALPALPDLARGSDRRELVAPLVAVVLLVVAVWAFMPGKISIEALEGDATEVHGFAASLFRGALPEWDLESGAWGFYPTFMFVSYPVFFSLALLGDSEAALRLPALLFLGAMLVTCADLAGRGRTRAAGGSLNVLVPLLVVAYLSAQVGAYYAGYHPFHGDLGCSPLVEWMVTGLALGALLLLRDGAPGLAAIAALLSVVTFPSGLMFAGLIGAAGLVVAGNRRRDVWRFGLAFGALALGYGVLLVVYTVANGSFDAMIGEWYAKYFEGRTRFGDEPVLRKVAALGWFTLLAGGLAILGPPLALLRGDRIARWMAVVTLAWVGFFVMSPNKNVHYFMPAALLPMATALRWTVGARLSPRMRLLTAAALTVSAVVCIALCRPRPVPPYTADRDFGRATLFLAGNERQAVEFSRVLFQVSKPLWRWEPGDPWTIGHHTWVMYADRGYEVDREYEFYVGRPPAPVPGLIEITRRRQREGQPVLWWSPRGRTALREWREKEYPLRRDLSRFHFEMTPDLRPDVARPEAPR
jgi:hypothetical protein